MINASKIRGRIVELEMTQQQVAAMIGMNKKTFSLKMKSGKFGLDEAEKLIEVLKIDKPEKYFFANEVTSEATQEGA